MMPTFDDYDYACDLLPPSSYVHVRRVAADTLVRCGVLSPPFPETALLNLLEPWADVLATTSGVYGYTIPLDPATWGKHAAIYINSSAAPDQVYITLFHEAAHVLLHILSARRLPDARYSRVVARPGQVPRPQAEIEADLFARLVTMPAPALREHWPYACTLTATPLEAAAWLARFYRVPFSWMVLRLAGLSLLELGSAG